MAEHRSASVTHADISVHMRKLIHSHTQIHSHTHTLTHSHTHSLTHSLTHARTYTLKACSPVVSDERATRGRVRTITADDNISIDSDLGSVVAAHTRYSRNAWLRPEQITQEKKAGGRGRKTDEAGERGRHGRAVVRTSQTRACSSWCWRAPACAGSAT